MDAPTTPTAHTAAIPIMGILFLDAVTEVIADFPGASEA
jgi:hypothetical protein